MTDQTIPIEELAPFLPYGLKFRDTDLKQDCLLRALYSTKTNSAWIGQSTEMMVYPKGYVKPLVRPMSTLSKPLPNGEIPIMELLKLAQAFGKWGIIPGTSRAKGEHGSYFEYYVGRFYFHCIHEIDAVPDQRPLFQYLFRHHFDVFDWLDRGLAIALEKGDGNDR